MFTPTRAAAALLLLLAAGCGFRTPFHAQRDRARAFTPATVQAPTSAAATGAPLRRMRIRVYADRGHRGHTVRWESEFRGTLERANAVLGPSFGVELVVVDLLPWDRDDAGERDLTPALEALEALDPGREVDWVIGLTSSLTAVTASVHHLGEARMLSRHFVLRAMSDTAEYAAIQSHLDLLPPDEREQVSIDRLRHKRLVVFLHEWAHTLGAIHLNNSSCLLSPQYSSHAAGFCRPNAELAAIGLKEHGAAGQTQSFRPWTQKMRSLLLSQRWPDLWATELEHTLKFLDAVIAHDDSSAKAAASAAPVPSEAELERLAAANAQARMAMYDEAWATLEPLLKSNTVNVLGLACYVSSSKAPSSARARETCEKAVERDPKDAATLLNLAQVHASTKNLPRAREALFRARDQLLLEKDPSRDGWAFLSRLAVQTKAVTLNEQAAPHLGDPKLEREARQWATRMRRSAGLPPDPARSGIAIEREGEYVERVYAAQRVVESGSAARGKAAADAVARDFPGSSGGSTLDCGLEFQGRRFEAAARECRKALEAYAEDVAAHYLLALLEERKGKLPEAIGNLRTVIDLDPGHRDAWRLLESLLRQSKDPDAVKALRAAYRKQFGVELY